MINAGRILLRLFRPLKAEEIISAQISKIIRQKMKLFIEKNSSPESFETFVEQYMRSLKKEYLIKDFDYYWSSFLKSRSILKLSFRLYSDGSLQKLSFIYELL